MDYFLSSGATTGVEPINTIWIQPIETLIPTMNTSLPLLDSLHQFIPAEILSLINLPLIWIVFIRVVAIIWVLKDSNYRSSSTSFCLFSLLLVTLGTPIIWLPIYLAIRPLGYKHERKYWKAMNESMEQTKMIIDEEAYIEEIEDEQHLAELRRQASLASRRAKKVGTKKPLAKTVIKKATTKPIARKIPTAKKAATRTAR